jgi:tripartite-type tricarboxylate transporter receptor subunit TctC
VLSVRPASPLRTLADLVAAAKASPGNVTYGSPGNGTLNHLAGPLLEMSAGIRMQHVPYRGASPAQLAVLSGEVDVLFDALPSSAPLLRDGRLRALAMGSPERMPGFTDIPTFVEQGHPEVVVMTWFGLAGPRNMPPALAQRMNETVISILHEPEMAERLTSLGSAPNRMAIPEFTRFVEQGIETWKRVVKAADIRLD